MKVNQGSFKEDKPMSFYAKLAAKEAELAAQQATVPAPAPTQTEPVKATAPKPVAPTPAPKQPDPSVEAAKAARAARVAKQSTSSARPKTIDMGQVGDMSGHNVKKEYTITPAGSQPVKVISISPKEALKLFVRLYNKTLVAGPDEVERTQANFKVTCSRTVDGIVAPERQEKLAKYFRLQVK